MITEIGHLALFLALAFSVLAATLPLYGARTGSMPLISAAPGLAVGQMLFVVVAFAALMHAYITSDFSVLNVAQNSHTAKPLIYKISGVWGNHEGSLLLWVMILTIFAAAVAVFGGGLPAAFRARVLAVQSIISTGFLLFLLTTSNPFERLDPAPVQGQGLNPLLQDPGLAFHPPVLYLGYVGFSIAFSFAIAALLEGRVNPAWARWVRPWTLVAWSFLTAGIALGSWWSYYELGWGGWWFWDPVENASFMPWLAGTALLHSVAVVEKRDTLKSWTILLAILTFSLSLLGTFLVRSGVLTSVHAFAVDPARGIFILAFLTFVTGGSLTLFAWRASSLAPGGLFAPVSREGGLVFNNLFLVTALATVFFGTLYPLFLDALAGEKISVGGPYYELTFVPLMVPLILVMGVGPMLSWKRAGLLPLKRLLLPIIGATILAAVVISYWGAAGFATGVGLVCGIWLIASSAVGLLRRSGLGRVAPGQLLRRAIGLPRAEWGLWLAHTGLGVAILGMTVSETWTTEHLGLLREGEFADVAGYRFHLETVDAVAGPNYTAMRGIFLVDRGDNPVARLFAEQRTYVSPPMQTTEAGIRTLMDGDLYAVIGDPTGDGRWSVRLYFKPLVAWIWTGALLMMLGGFVSMSDQRARQAMRARFALRPAAGQTA